MYKGASDLSQSRHGRQVVVDAMVAGGRGETISAADELASVQAALRDLDRKILAAPPGEKRRRLGVRKQELALTCRKLKERARGVPKSRRHAHAHIGSYFIDAAKERLPRQTYDLIMREALAARDADAEVQALAEPATDPDIAGVTACGGAINHDEQARGVR